MSKLNKTKELEYILFNHYFLKKGYRLALEVYISGYKRRVDLIGMDKTGSILNIEIKVTKADFKSKNGHTFIGNKNYYAMPPELYEQVKDKVPKDIGVLVASLEKTTFKGKTVYTPTVKVAKRATTIDTKLTTRQLKALKDNIITATNSNIRRLLEERHKLLNKIEELKNKELNNEHYWNG